MSTADTPRVSRETVERVRAWSERLLPTDGARGLSPADLDALCALAEACLDAERASAFAVAESAVAWQGMVAHGKYGPALARVRAHLQTGETEA